MNEAIEGIVSWAATTGFLLVTVFLVLGGLFQLVLVPMKASAKGLDGGLWLMITFIWLLLFWGAGLVGWFFLGADVFQPTYHAATP